ncbi:hypothetical protein ACFSGI_22720 [Paenibacillus nicotianae]|uniref:Uncharacterized protein n=1 Tax=Paenibacillus nicotianae TaxID=1526551 RepID=A0ABW4V2R5_9BACL
MNIANFSAISTSGKYPTSSISAVGSGTLEVKGSTANNLGVNVDILKSAGFNISYTTTKEWVARKFVTSTLSVDI